jgi:hypothetical protein
MPKGKKAASTDKKPIVFPENRKKTTKKKPTVFPE